MTFEKKKGRYDPRGFPKPCIKCDEKFQPYSSSNKYCEKCRIGVNASRKKDGKE